MSDKENINWMNNIRVLATIAVIVLHIATIPVIAEYSSLICKNRSSIYWHVANIFDSVCRFCVPVFVMLTGALLLPQQISLRSFLKKRVNRILLPFIFWSIIYTVFNIVLIIKHQGHITLLSIIKLLVNDFLQGASFHLWYIYMIVCLYFFIPIIGPWIRKATNNELLFFLTIWAFCLLSSHQNIIVININLNFQYFSGYVGYLVLGYFIAHKVQLNRNMILLSVIMFLIGFFITCSGTYLSSLKQGAFSHKWYDYLTFNVALMSAGIFLFFKAWNPDNMNYYLRALCTLISRHSYGIYLVHVLILGLLSLVGLNYQFINPFLGILVTAVSCLSLSLSTIYIINRLPLGKYISG